MPTDQAIYFVLLAGAALFAYVFGFHALIGGVVILLAGLAWMRARHPRSWKGSGYQLWVKQGLREEAWVEYHTSLQDLSFRAEWQFNTHDLRVFVDQNVYSTRDYAAPLSPEQLAEVLRQIDEGLSALKISHEFTDTHGQRLPDLS